MVNQIRPLEFNPSSAIMQGAGALGDWSNNLIKQAYQDERNKIAEAQAQRHYDFQVNRANTQDQQWKQNYDASRQDANRNYEFQLNRANTQNNQWQQSFEQNAKNHQDDIALKNKSLGLTSREFGLKERIYNDTQDGYTGLGQQYFMQHPEYKDVPFSRLGRIAEKEMMSDPYGYKASSLDIKKQQQEETARKNQAYLDEQKAKALEDQKVQRAKLFPKFQTNIPMYEKLSPEQQSSYMDYYVSTGNTPKINKQSTGWFSNSYNFQTPTTVSSEENKADIAELNRILSQLKNQK